MASAKKTAAEDLPAKKAPAKQSTSKGAASGAAENKLASRRSVSLLKSGKDPKGGLTAEGRRIYNEAIGGHLKPGVRGNADTPEKILRKGSFLRRHFAHPQGPVVDGNGQPTRQAFEAAAWGEPVPTSEAEEKTLAEKGTELLEQYHAAKGEVKTASGRWKPAPGGEADGARRSGTVSKRAGKAAPNKS